MKIILSGGGTGGHVNPALAIGDAVARHVPGTELHYVGTPSGIENKLVPDRYTMHHIEIKGLRRSLSPKNIKVAYLTLTSFIKAKKLLKELRPDAVIGTGGYVCWPICAAASSAGIPVFLHESNAEPGFAVRMLEKKADVIFVNFAESGEQLPHAKKIVHVGTPLREQFYTLTKEKARKTLEIPDKYQKIVLSFGGSLGAAVLNERVLEMMVRYGKEHPEILFVHATGASGKEKFMAAFRARGLDRYENLSVREYIYDMPACMAAADLVICRSGAMTLSELAVLAKPSILIPSPNVTNDQQTKNARLFADKGGAILFRECDMTENSLSDTLEKLFADPEVLRTMSDTAATFAVRNAEEVIVRTILGKAGE